MGQAYLLIFIGILFTRLNFYVPTIGIDVLPDMIGYLLTLYAAFRLYRLMKSSVSIASIVLALFFLVNEITKSYLYPLFIKAVITALIFSVLLMAAQIAMYTCIFHTEYQISENVKALQYKKYYLFISIGSLLIYLYLCFFGGYLLLMNLASLIETSYLLAVFFQLYRKHRLF